MRMYEALRALTLRGLKMLLGAHPGLCADASLRSMDRSSGQPARRYAALQLSRSRHGIARPLGSHESGGSQGGKVQDVIPFDPEGLSDQRLRHVRDDLIAHVAAGGTVGMAAAQLREIYPASLIGPRAHALMVIAMACTAWEIGRLPPFLKSEAMRLLQTLMPPTGVDPASWAAQQRQIASRLDAAQPPCADLSAAKSKETNRAGLVWQLDAADASRAILLLPLARHWAQGGFHRLALAVDPSGKALLPTAPGAPPCLFMIPAESATVTPRADLRLPRRIVARARKQARALHTRIIAPDDLPSGCAGLLR